MKQVDASRKDLYGKLRGFDELSIFLLCRICFANGECLICVVIVYIVMLKKN